MCEPSYQVFCPPLQYPVGQLVEVESLGQCDPLEPVELGPGVLDSVGGRHGAPPAQEGGVGHHGTPADVHVVPHAVEGHAAPSFRLFRYAGDLSQLVPEGHNSY